MQALSVTLCLVTLGHTDQIPRNQRDALVPAPGCGCCSHLAPLPHLAAVIRYVVLLITLLGTWLIMQTYFHHSWRAISLRSWLGEAPTGSRGMRREGARGSIASQPSELDIAALTTRVCSLWPRL